MPNPPDRLAHVDVSGYSTITAKEDATEAAFETYKTDTGYYPNLVFTIGQVVFFGNYQ